MNVSLTSELEAMVEAQVRSGEYRSASEVVRDALRLFQRRKEEYEAEGPRAMAQARANLRS